MTVKDRLLHRTEHYADMSNEGLLRDACRDMEELLNVFTDIDVPDAQDIRAMEALSRAVKDLHGCLHHDSQVQDDADPPWVAHWPEIAKKKRELDAAFAAFLTAKHGGKDAANMIPGIFAAHGKLAQAVQALCTTPAETAAIKAAVKAS